MAFSSRKRGEESEQSKTDNLLASESSPIGFKSELVDGDRQKSVYAWGQNKDGELAVSKSQAVRQPTTGEENIPLPQRVPCLSGKQWPSRISSGVSHTVVLGKAGGVFVIGSAILSKISQKVVHKLNQKKFAEIPGLNDKLMKEVECGDYYTTIITEEGTLYTWGGALNTKLFRRESRVDPNIQDIVRPLQYRRIKQVACGDFHTIALEVNGQIWTWGGGTHKNRGQCGHANTQEVPAPRQMAYFENRFMTMVAAGG